MERHPTIICGTKVDEDHVEIPLAPAEAETSTHDGAKACGGDEVAQWTRGNGGAVSRDEWYIRDTDGAIQGPFDTRDMKRLISRDLIWTLTDIKRGSNPDAEFLPWRKAVPRYFPDLDVSENLHDASSAPSFSLKSSKGLREHTDNILRMVNRRNRTVSNPMATFRDSATLSFKQRKPNAFALQTPKHRNAFSWSEQAFENLDVTSPPSSSSKSRGKQLIKAVATPRRMKTNSILSSFRSGIDGKVKIRGRRSRRKQKQAAEKEGSDDFRDATDEEVDDEEEAYHVAEEDGHGDAGFGEAFGYAYATANPDSEPSTARTTAGGGPGLCTREPDLGRPSMCDALKGPQADPLPPDGAPSLSLGTDPLAKLQDENSQLRTYVRDLLAFIHEKCDAKAPVPEKPGFLKTPPLGGDPYAESEKGPTGAAQEAHSTDQVWESTLKVEYSEDSPSLRRKIGVYEDSSRELSNELQTLVKKSVLLRAATGESIKGLHSLIGSFNTASEMRKISPFVGSFHNRLAAISELQEELLKSFEEHYILGCEEFWIGDLTHVEFLRRKLLRARDVYEAAESKYMSHRRGKNRSINTVGRTYETVDAILLGDLQDAKVELELARFGLVQKINHLENKKRFKLLGHTAAYAGHVLHYFRQGYIIMSECANEIRDANSCVGGSEVMFRESVARWNEKRSLLESELYASASPFQSKDRVERKVSAFPYKAVVESRSTRSSRDPSILREGFLYKRSSSVRKNWKKRWFSLRGDKLLYYRDFDDVEPQLVCDILLCTVRPVSSPMDLRHCFEIISPNKRTYMLQALSEYDMSTWISAIRKAIELQLGHQVHRSHRRCSSQESLTLSEEHLSKVLSGNKVCADCGSPDPTWVSINLGLVVCIRCSGVHRSLGSHISKIRSTTLDQSPLIHVKIIQRLGNSCVNAILEKALDRQLKPARDADDCQVTAFIKDKYVNKKFAECRKGAVTIDTVCSAIRGNDVPLLLRCIIDTPSLLNTQTLPRECHLAPGSTVLHLAAALHKAECFELMFLNGADITLRNQDGENPVELARRVSLTVPQGNSVNPASAELGPSPKKRGSMMSQSAPSSPTGGEAGMYLDAGHFTRSSKDDMVLSQFDEATSESEFSADA